MTNCEKLMKTKVILNCFHLHHRSECCYCPAASSCCSATTKPALITLTVRICTICSTKQNNNVSKTLSIFNHSLFDHSCTPCLSAFPTIRPLNVSTHWRMLPSPQWGSMWSGSGGRRNAEKLKGMSPLGMSQQLLGSLPLRLELCQKHAAQSRRCVGDSNCISLPFGFVMDKKRPSVRC